MFTCDDVLLGSGQGIESSILSLKRMNERKVVPTLPHVDLVGRATIEIILQHMATTTEKEH